MSHSDSDHSLMIETDPHRDLTHGDIVVDRDRGDSHAVVVSRLSVIAEDWYVPQRGTLAVDNPDYPSDDRVVCVIYQDTLAESYPYYSGVKPLAISALHEAGVQFYAFPESRLRAVGQIKRPRIDLADIRPSPYHAQSFQVAENRTFIQQIRRQGDVTHLPSLPPLFRPLDNGFELLNGHKRIWAAHVASLSHVTARGIYCSNETAARTFVNAHLDSYGPAECRKATWTIREHFDTETANDILF